MLHLRKYEYGIRLMHHPSRERVVMARSLICQACGKDEVLRSRCFSTLERVLNLFFGLSPFRCQFCSHRFLAFRVGRRYPTHLIDRREHRRIPVHLSLSFSGGRVQGTGTIIDISKGGCIIRSDTVVRVGEIFYLQIVVVEQDSPIEVAAMVHSVSARGIGFRFLRAAREDRRLIAFLRSQGA